MHFTKERSILIGCYFASQVLTPIQCCRYEKNTLIRHCFILFRQKGKQAISFNSLQAQSGLQTQIELQVVSRRLRTSIRYQHIHHKPCPPYIYRCTVLCMKVCLDMPWRRCTGHSEQRCLRGFESRSMDKPKYISYKCGGEKHTGKIPEQSTERTRHMSTTWTVFILDL